MRIENISIRYLLILFLIKISPASVVASENKDLLEKADTSKSIEYPGCPDNSKCTKEQGAALMNWQALLKNLENSKTDVSSKLELYRKKYGIPSYFWVKNQRSDIVTWDSECKNHRDNPRKILIQDGLAHVVRFDEKNITMSDSSGSKVYKLGEDIELMPLIVYDPVTEYHKLYQTMKDDYPLFLDGEDLVILREEEGIYYAIGISPPGNIKIVDVDNKTKTLAKQQLADTLCPKSLNKIVESFGIEKKTFPMFSGHFCKTIWNSKKQRTVIVVFYYTCQ